MLEDLLFSYIYNTCKYLYLLGTTADELDLNLAYVDSIVSYDLYTKYCSANTLEFIDVFKLDLADYSTNNRVCTELDDLDALNNNSANKLVTKAVNYYLHLTKKFGIVTRNSM